MVGVGVIESGRGQNFEKIVWGQNKMVGGQNFGKSGKWGSEKSGRGQNFGKSGREVKFSAPSTFLNGISLSKNVRISKVEVWGQVAPFYIPL